MKKAACLLGQMDILEKGSGKLGLYQNPRFSDAPYIGSDAEIRDWE